MKPAPFVILAALLSAPGAQAQDTAAIALPPEQFEEHYREQFMQCRVALLHEINFAEEPAIPRVTAQVMNGQIELIMAETLFNAPSLTYADGERRLRFVEAWMLDFGVAMTRHRDEMADVAHRRDILLSCQPILWIDIRNRYDALIQWRAHAMALSEPPIEATKRFRAPE